MTFYKYVCLMIFMCAVQKVRKKTRRGDVRLQYLLPFRICLKPLDSAEPFGLELVVMIVK